MERLHKLAAIIVFAFLCLHFAAHFALLFGPDAHAQVMDAVRIPYRYPAVEYGLFSALAVLAITGLPLIWEIWTRPKDLVHQVQAASGLVLFLFIAGHLGWVQYAREIRHDETGLAFVRDALVSPRWHRWAFAFYGAGLGALFLHFGCILHGIYKKSSPAIGRALLVTTACLGVYVTWVLLRAYAGIPF